jgi:demethylmenaquinone methyltransferase / 2-methoxy-6-polyprenyl-1,4-benzoquinol methylase
MPATSTGTTPPGAANEAQAAAWVRGMFGRIAGRYDLLNHVLSFNMDKRWRAITVRRVAHILDRPGAQVLDLCCGTGDVLLSLEEKRGASVFGSDFCHPMLTEAKRKIERKHFRSSLFEADALQLPLHDASLDLITIAFGFRNLSNYDTGFAELLRVLKPGGTVAILEFSQPTNRIFGAAYHFFSSKVLPAIGGMISGSRDAYTYLPESIGRFPGADELAVRMRSAGFAKVEFERMTGGSVALHLGTKL